GALAPGNYVLKLVGDAAGLRNGFGDLLEGAGGTGRVYEYGFTVTPPDMAVAVEDAVFAPDERLGTDGEGLAISLTHAGGVQSMLLRLGFDPAMLDVADLTASAPGLRIVEEGESDEQDGWTARRYRLIFDAPPVAGTVEIA